MTYQHIPTWMFVVASPRYPLIVGKEPDFTCESFRYVKVRCHEVAFRFFDVFSTLKKCLAALNFIYMKWQFFDVCYIVLQPPPKPPPPGNSSRTPNRISSPNLSSRLKSNSQFAFIYYYVLDILNSQTILLRNCNSSWTYSISQKNKNVSCLAKNFKAFWNHSMHLSK